MKEKPSAGGRAQPAPPLPTGVGLAALGMAVERSAEAERPDRLFEDRLADATASTVRGVARAAGLATEVPGGGLWHAMRAVIALRTRHFDDAARAATDAGCRQFVVLGAGMDARAFRLPWAEGTRLFEVDHSDVLTFKQHLADRADQRPDCARLPVAADLRGDWTGTLRAAGFDPWQPTCWLLEGLLPHLGVAANDRLLREVSALSAAGSRLMLDHFNAELTTSAAYARIGEALRAVGMGWRSTLEEPLDWLSRYGWTGRTARPADLAPHGDRAVPEVFGTTGHGGGRVWLVTAVR